MIRELVEKTGHQVIFLPTLTILNRILVPQARMYAKGQKTKKSGQEPDFD